MLQQTDESPLQTIVTGRYHDRFERVDGQWRYSYRDLTLIDMVGDVSHHLTLSHCVARARLIAILGISRIGPDQCRA